jgi:hypothetical protein
VITARSGVLVDRAAGAHHRVMADQPETLHDDAEEQPEFAAGVLQPQPAASEVAVRRQSPAVVWRNRTLALREALPRLARHPAVAGASAAAATIVLRVAVDAVARRALGVNAPARPAALDVTGRIVHHVHVFHHVRVVHVVHDPADYVRSLLPPTRR